MDNVKLMVGLSKGAARKTSALELTNFWYFVPGKALLYLVPPADEMPPCHLQMWHVTWALNQRVLRRTSPFETRDSPWGVSLGTLSHLFSAAVVFSSALEIWRNALGTIAGFLFFTLHGVCKWKAWISLGKQLGPRKVPEAVPIYLFVY